MKKKLLAVLAGWVMMFGMNAVTNATIISAIQDANISSGSHAGTNYGSYVGLTTYWSDVTQSVGLVQFDTNVISSAAITSATLNLFHSWNNGSGADFAIYRNTSSWDEYNVTWNTAPSYYEDPVAHLTIEDSNTWLWRSVDITSLVQGWVSGVYDNFGLRLQRIDQLSPVVYFAQKDSGEVHGYNHSAYLDVNTSSVPEPATMLLFGTGIVGLFSSAVVCKR